jgi:hypothetical protein
MEIFFPILSFVFCFLVRSQPGHSPDDYYNNHVEAVTILRDNLVRTIVNLVPMFDVTPLPDLGDRLICPTIQR